MAAVKSKDTAPELAVRAYLYSRGVRYRLHVKSLPGTPDVFIPRLKVAVFVNGCFWHGHVNCSRAKIPDSGRDFWLNKISKNTKRDEKNYAALSSAGYKVVVIWGCEAKQASKLAERLAGLVNEYHGENT